MANELVNAVVVDTNIGLCQLPDRTLDASQFGRCEDLVHGTVLLTVWMRQAELDRQWLQRAIVFEEEHGPRGVDFVGGGVDSVQVWDQFVMVIQDVEPVPI